MDLDTWANVAEIASLATILFAAAFAIFQLRAESRARQESAAFAIVQRFMDDNAFICAVRCVKELPNDWQSEPIDSATRAHLDQLYMVLETIGYAVNRGAVRLDDVEALMGGVVREIWKQLEPLAKQERVNSPRAYEWSQWLYNALESARPNGDTIVYAQEVP